MLIRQLFFAMAASMEASMAAPIVTAKSPQKISSFITIFTLAATYAIMMVAINSCIHDKGGENMEVMEMSKEELMKISVEEFSRIQDWMIVSPKDSEAYIGMKKRYDELKVILASLNVNVTGIDKIKE